MPPIANIISGKTSVCSRPCVDASRSASVPGQRRGLAGERGDAALEVPLGEQQHADQREQQDRAPDEHRRAVDRDRALDGDLAAAAASPLSGSRSVATTTVATSAASEADRGRARSGRGSGARAGHERLDERRRRSATPKTISSGESRPYSMLGLGERRLRGSLGGSPPAAAACAGTVGAGSCTPTCCSVSATAGLMIEVSGFGKKPSTTISTSSGASAATSRTLRSLHAGDSRHRRAGHRALVHQQDVERGQHDAEDRERRRTTSRA